MEKNIPPLNGALPTPYYQYPSLLKRFQSNFIDRIITYTLAISLVYASGMIDKDSFILKAIALFIALSYEPVLITTGRTVGQLVMGIRVKHLSMDQRMPLINAFARFWLRMMLGWISFITIHTNPERRAIHDLATGAVVIEL